MNRLSFVLSTLISDARRLPAHASAPFKFKEGLIVSVRLEDQTPVLHLTRDALTPPSRVEAATCGQALNWWGPRVVDALEGGLRALLVREAVAPTTGFCPGRPMYELPRKLPMHTLCGLAVAGDWVTILQFAQDQYRWRTIRGPHHGEGAYSRLQGFLDDLRSNARKGSESG
ncbi:hypothetical protein K7W42_19235 [Deinococcus sp. HMF7604]|uniref:hypothetical protein n=1 Tax=Deinococcus betulae TaxID=2873312 RepID=UPI001CCE8BB6|nr:hypothetical protein [Deinococcus betulae]MBZ9752975.1 hypothetical protein [Deinococcus betulae]